MGDSLLRPTGEPWLNALIPKAPKLDINKLDQIAALPLGSQLKIDAWDDKVIRLNARAAPIMNARDKMPFEVTPVFFRLTRYTPPAAQLRRRLQELQILRLPRWTHSRVRLRRRRRHRNRAHSKPLLEGLPKGYPPT